LKEVNSGKYLWRRESGRKLIKGLHQLFSQMIEKMVGGAWNLHLPARKYRKTRAPDHIRRPTDHDRRQSIISPRTNVDQQLISGTADHQRSQGKNKTTSDPHFTLPQGERKAALSKKEGGGKALVAFQEEEAKAKKGSYEGGPVRESPTQESRLHVVRRVSGET